jgi:adenylate cyclase
MIISIIKKIGLGIILLFCALCIFTSINLSGPETQGSVYAPFINFTNYFEDRFYDFRMNQSLGTEGQTDERLVLASIDDESVGAIGRFPWSRTVWSKLIRKIYGYGGKIIAFDVFFFEDEKACNAESPDIDLANSIKEFQSIPGNKIILPYSIVDYIESGEKELPEDLYNFILDSEQNGRTNLQKHYVGKEKFPIPLLSQSEAGLAHVQAIEDNDGIFRKYHMVGNIDDLYFPSLSLLIYQYYKNEKIKVHISSIGDAYIKLKSGDINLDSSGRAKLRWFGGQTHFPYVSIKKILESPENDPDLNKLLGGKVIFIGSTTYGAHDFRHTPIESKLPGVYFHMNMANALLEGRFFVHEDKSTLFSWAILFLGTLLMITVMIKGNAILDITTLMTLIVGLYCFDTYHLTPNGYDIKLFFCLLSILACYSWSTFWHFYLTSKEKTKIRGTFSRFVAPAIVNKMLDNPELVKVGGEKKDITVHFSDVRDFTSISEKLTPEQLTTCLNQYMGVMTDILFETYGTLDKYIGDAIVAYWGAPVDLENHAYHAVRGSLRMIEALPAINEKFKEQGFPEFRFGIGLNSGECSVGNMGSDKIFSYTALGDNMNLGARLEGLCKPYGVQLNISEYTLNAIPEDLRQEFTYRILDKVRVKGKENAVTIYEVFHSFHPFKKDPAALKDYLRAFDIYLQQDFSGAIALLDPLLETYPADVPTQRLKKACEEFIANPPGKDWDGVVTFTTK